MVLSRMKTESLLLQKEERDDLENHTYAPHQGLSVS